MSVNGAVAGATTEQLEAIKADLEKQRDERMAQVVNGDPMLRELTGAIKGVEFALNGPPPTEEEEAPAE
tara:strand:+ start:579 stop:785 length:207 start_codon:yes stop_codon:yes gene_type:complete